MSCPLAKLIPGLAAYFAITCYQHGAAVRGELLAYDRWLTEHVMRCTECRVLYQQATDEWLKTSEALLARPS